MAIFAGAGHCGLGPAVAQVSKYAILAAIALIAAAVAVALFYRGRAVILAADLERAQSRITQYEEAAKIHRAHIERLQAAQEYWDTVQHDLQAMEGRDAPLSDHLGRAAVRLWGR